MLTIVEVNRSTNTHLLHKKVTPQIQNYLTWRPHLPKPEWALNLQEQEDEEQQDDGEGEGLAVHVVSDFLCLAASTLPTASTATEAHASHTERTSSNTTNQSHYDQTNPPCPKLKQQVHTHTYTHTLKVIKI